MPSRRIADDLLDAVFDAFGSVLPDGVYLVKEGRSHSAESRDGSSAGGIVSAAVPPFPVPDDDALRLGLHGYAETLRHFVSEVADAPWPRAGTETRCSVSDGIRIWFGPRLIEHAVVVLPVVGWSGPVFDYARAPESDAYHAPRYAGALTAEERAQDAQLRKEIREEHRATQAATNAAFAATRARAAGTRFGNVRAVVHEEFTARGQQLPRGVEGFIAGLLSIRRKKN